MGGGVPWELCSGPRWGRTGPGVISPPPRYESKQVWPFWFLKEGAQLGRAIEIALAGEHAGPLTSVQEAEGRKSMFFQAFTMSHCHPSPKCAERRGCSQVLDFLQVTEVLWGHSRLDHDSAGIALRSLHWPEWECCSQDGGVAGWGCFLVLGTHLQKSQVIPGPGKFA